VASSRGPIWCIFIEHVGHSACRRYPEKCLIKDTFISDGATVRATETRTQLHDFFAFLRTFSLLATKSSHKKSIQRFRRLYHVSIQPCSKLQHNPSSRRLHNKPQEYKTLLGPSQPTALLFTLCRRTAFAWLHRKPTENALATTQAMWPCRKHKVFNRLPLRMSRLSVPL
jgi:hypothetical protein